MTESSQISTESGGATLRSLYVEREVKVYAIHEVELDTLGSFNAIATVFFAFASAMLAYAIGILTNAAFAEKLTPAGELATKLVAPILFLVGLACVLAGCWALWRRNAAWGKIKEQSKGGL